MILEINAKREIHQHLRSMQTSHPLIPCRVRLQPQCSGTLQLLLVMHMFPTGGNYVSSAVLLTCARSTNILYRWTQEINRISNHIIHLTSPLPPAFALVLQPKRHFWFLRSSETQAHWGSWGHPRPFANWYPFKLGDGWHMLTPLWPALVPYYKICISPNWGTPKRFGFPPKKTTTHDNKLDALGV